MPQKKRFHWNLGLVFIVIHINLLEGGSLMHFNDFIK